LESYYVLQSHPSRDHNSDYSSQGHGYHTPMQSKMADRSNLKFNHEGAMKFKQSVVFLSWPVATLDVLAVWCWCRLRDFSSSSKIKTQSTLHYPTFLIHHAYLLEGLV
jgi:hypothetical protein